MPNNSLNHDRTLSNLNTEAKYAKLERRWSRYGRNGETYKCSAWRAARRRYNRAARKASKLQLSRYHEHCAEVNATQEDITWDGWWCDDIWDAA